ncbi:unnamed protein product [Rotaria socialis]|nr:unnamed protein product [Rotaria socialis]CAF3339086.1 unnamed protein product [Rotaria socialis]CAF4675127.1 unnamed protein product [Rotaria socialis]CAF4844374.1 unnamed protein product [Rotaria socialis]
MDTFLSPPTDHNHAPNPERIPVIELHNEIKVRAVTSEESTSIILHSSLRMFPLSATSELPRTEMLKQTIRRQRQTPATTSTDDLTDDLRKTYRGEDFLLHEEKDMIIFTTKSNLSALKQSKHWFADGTFKVCPNDFYQLFTLHALMTSTIIPLVYGLLIGKSSNDYNGFFRKVLDQDNFQPETILSDFETGTIKTIKDMLPNVTHKGCLFHFGQSVWRHVQNKGLSTKYKEDENFRLNVKMLIGLAYLPLSDVITGFDLVAGEFDDDADDLLDYFEKTWIGEPRRRGAGRKKPQFDHALWNVYDRVITDLPRSNNSVEGWHNAFASRVTVAHPTIKKLVEKIRREQSKFEIDIAHLLQGHQPKPKKACYRKLDERIARLVRGYDPLQIHQYLKNIAANVSL